MKIIALDLSSNTGWAKFEFNQFKCDLLDYGLIELDKKIDYFTSWEDPEIFWNIFHSAKAFADNIYDKLILKEEFPYQVVIERTNLGRQRSSQTFLEWLHFCFLMKMIGSEQELFYLDSSQWRKAVGMLMSKEDKKNNQDVKKGKKRGKITKKHLSVRLVNDLFKDKLRAPLKLKDNDISDAILLGYSKWIIMKII